MLQSQDFLAHFKTASCNRLESVRHTFSEKHSKSNLENLPKTAAFFSENDEVVNDNYKLKDKEFISIIPPIGGG